ncbi:MAG: hypothetical protein J6K48_03675 [Lachnospiraceae bacterium]|nr:hypothetical protein [Lachnospiraceae bacterium]
MKIGEARKAYASQLSYQRNQRSQLLKQQEEYKKKLEQEQKNRITANGGANVTGVTLELSDEYLQKYTELQEQIDTLTAQIEKNEKGLDDVISMEVGIANMEVAKQQGDVMKEAAADMAKCLEIARRISRGDKVPAQDEKKLMDFNMEIYQIAKNMAVMNRNKKHKEWESLWEDEEEKKEYPDPMEIAANTEMNIAMPEGAETVPEQGVPNQTA